MVAGVNRFWLYWWLAMAGCFFVFLLFVQVHT